MPRIRCAMRSGWKRSNCVELLARRGEQDRACRSPRAPTARRRRARRRRACVSITPSKPTAAANCSATLTASWPVIASTTSSTWSGLIAVADRDELVHQLRVDVQAPGGVDDQHVLAVGARALERPARDLDRRALGALLVDRRAGLLADA